MKLFSTLLLATWLLCWVQCFAEQTADRCCGSPFAENQEFGAKVDCDCVQTIFSKGINLADEIVAMPASSIELPSAFHFSEHQLSETATIPHEPLYGLRLWELMARTAAPVRGPTLSA